MHLQASPPSLHWKVTIGDHKLTCLNSFRIRLLVRCDELKADAACFHSRTTNAQPGDPSCNLLNQGVCVYTCPILDERREKLYQRPRPLYGPKSRTRSRVHPQDFLEVMTGMCWVDDTNVQKFCIHFLSKLKAVRTALLFPDLS